MSASSPLAPALVWFRDDLRLADQPALRAAIETGAPVLCVYVWDEESPGLRAMGGASKWWLHQSLLALGKSLEKIGGRLDILRGPAQDVLLPLAANLGHVFWTRRYGAAEIRIDEAIKSALKDAGIEAKSFNGQLLFEPWTVRTKVGDYFRVFTPFWRACLALPDPDQPTPAPKKLKGADWPKGAPARVTLDQMGLLPVKPDWAAGFRESWTPGEAGAKARVAHFLENGLKIYGDDRNRPDIDATSRLSAHIRFGEISPRQLFYAARHVEDSGEVDGSQVSKFLSEIGWREFSYHLLFHNPELATKNFQAKFDAFPWREANSKILHAWQRGQTGYPLVDAGMRELWQTGTMHNRVRMVAASFLVKHLLIDWRIGEEWFWDTLCDACPANNAASWQWVAGSGADAAPYFRIFNPILQGDKFDPEGIYTRRFVPELAKLPDQWLQKPWEASPSVLAQAGVVLGKTYPKPIVDHSAARDAALAALSTTKVS